MPSEPPAAPRPWSELVKLGAGYLAKHGTPDARVAAELLMARLCRCGRGFLSSLYPRIPAPVQVEAMRRGLARVAKGEPVQYVLGEWDFRSLTLKVDRRALIPRPETEELVTRVLASPLAKAPRPFVVDIGTGTGCIVLSLAKEMPDGIFLGVDISPDAIALATENAARTGLASKVRFAVADGCDEFEPQSVDVLVSNPPYISTAECDALDPRIRTWEPRLALDGGAEGLDFYDRLLGDAINVLKPGGGVFFEIGDGQGGQLGKLMFDYGFEDIRIEKDYAGHDRYAMAVCK